MEVNAAQLLTAEITIEVIGLFLAYRCISFQEGKRKQFRNYVLVLNLFLLLNIPIRCVELQLVTWNRDLVFWMYAASVLLMTALMYCWLLFLLTNVGSRLVRTKQRCLILGIPGLLMIPLCIINRHTGWMYYIDEQSHYSRGSIFVLQAAVSYSYLLLIVVITLFHLFREGNSRNAKRGFFTLVPAIIFAYLQVTYGGSFLPVGATLAGIIMYVQICLEIQQEIEESKYEDEARINKAHADDIQTLFNQTVETLAGTIDAKDRYTNGHSFRVAKYARMIANLHHYPENICREVYLAGLLHDIGKISVNDAIINKPGKLTDEEYAQIKMHPAFGAHILTKMAGAPYLKDGANFHHERYDGRGYPLGLKGKEIPEYARIIAVADAYDAMTSRRSYRNTIDQVEVKQEIWKNMGTQFDPLYAKYMIALIDADTNFEMRGKGDREEFLADEAPEEVEWNTETPAPAAAPENDDKKLDFTTLAAYVLTEDHWYTPDCFIKVQYGKNTSVRVFSKASADAKYIWNTPAVIVFSSRDGKLLGDGYDELAVGMSAGYSWRAGTALDEEMEFRRKNDDRDFWDQWMSCNKAGMEFTISARRDSRYVYLTVESHLASFEGRVKLSDRYGDGRKNIYVAVTGDTCDMQVLDTGD